MTGEESPKCSTCGTTMCEQFDDGPEVNGMTISVPNGIFKCYRCQKTTADPYLKRSEKKGI